MEIVKKAKLVSLVAALNVFVFGCEKPEIAEVLEDYCQFQKDCKYVHINKDTQYHNISSCDKFHRRLLKDVARGKSSGCRSDVEDFFIEYMEGQMAFGCSADLATTLNQSIATQEQLDIMLTCVKESSANVSQKDLAQMGCTVLEKLEIGFKDLSEEVCQTILANVMADDKKAQTMCKLVSLMSEEGANNLCATLVGDSNESSSEN